MNSQALANAEAALKQLVAFLDVPVVSDRDRAGVIQAFEFTFEAVWKLLKHLAESEGLAAESPKRALIAGYKIGVIEDENLWLNMLADRNLTSHIYHVDVADRIFAAIRDRYLAAFRQTVTRARATVAP